ncbi:putative transmembrane protein [Toxoplasma gondii TgCatPRC2]|uniref:Putative transmembrane protein n=1 Tax=Toxoplasma gondii TgCatPRC2 TaxID=1130821 RepID=A0A151HAL9_TOXGO|nr:putative transmembrane protein [Toxoplasma gondii TgCatPRC2]
MEDKQRMTQCPAAGDSFAPLSVSQFFPVAAVATAADRSASFHSGRQQHVSTAVSAVRQPRDGFLVELPFTLAEESFVLAEVQYNFFLSHVELDVVEGGNRHMQQESISFGELDFVNKGNHPLNTRQWVATQLEPGNYVLRVADDHYGSHFPRSFGGDPCFPLKFQFQVFSLASHETRPTVIGVHPDPSVPVKYGQDLVVLLRLSTPPSVAGEGAASSEAVRRSAYLFGDSGVTLYPTHFANLDSYEDASDAEREGANGGVTWSFLFTADKLQRLGNSAKLVLEFTSKRGGQPYGFGILRSGLRTPDAEFSSGDPSDYVTEVTYTFLAPGVLRENAPWTGDLGRFAVKSPPVSTPGDDVRRPAKPPSAAATGAVHPEEETPRGTPGSPRLRDLDRASSSPSPVVSRGPLVPPKVSRSELLVEEEETKPARFTPWNAPAVAEEPRRHPDPYAAADEKETGSAWRSSTDEEELSCPPGTEWNEATAECEDVSEMDAPGTLLLIFVSLIGVTSLLLLSRYVLRRRTKNEYRHPYRLARANSGGSDSFDFLTGRSAVTSPSGVSDRDDDV